MKRYIVHVIACVLVLSSSAFALTGEEAVRGMQQRLSAVSRISGVISITYATGETMTGSFVYARPNKLHIKFSNPSGKEVVTNGRKLWVYSPSSKICGSQDLDPGLSGGLGAVVNGYPAIMTSQRSDGYTVKLKDDTKHYSEIQLGLSRDFFPEKMVFRTSDGKGFTIILTNINFSPRVIDSFFDFNVPSNCQVVKNPLNIK